MRLLVHATAATSRANGPGARFVLWTQGCALDCPGCFNPETHGASAGAWRSTTDLAEEIARTARRRRLEGVTLSGGEPLEQVEALHDLLDRLDAFRTDGLDLGRLLFTGWTVEEIAANRRAQAFVDRVDAAICGRFDARSLAPRGVVASSNQEIVLSTSRYGEDALRSAPQTEVVLHTDGAITLTGVQPVRGLAARGRA